MPIQTFTFLNYYAIVLAVGKDKVFLLMLNLRFLLSKLGALVKVKLIQTKNGFSTITVEKVVRGPQKYFYSQNTIA